MLTTLMVAGFVALLLFTILGVGTVADATAARVAAAEKMGVLLDECGKPDFKDSAEFDEKFDAATDEYAKAQKEEEAAIAASNRRTDRLAMRDRIGADASRLDGLLRDRARPDFDPNSDPRSRGANAPTNADMYREGIKIWASQKMPQYVEGERDRAIAKACGINLNSDEIFLPSNRAITRSFDAMQEEFIATGSKSQALRASREAVASWNTMTPDSAAILTEPPQILRQIEINRMAWGGLLAVATTRNTATGEDLILPFINDNQVKGRRISEDGPLGTENNPKVSGTKWGSYKYTSDLIAATYEMLRDAFFDLEGTISEIGGERLGRVENYEMTLGTGGSMPRGIAFAATVSVTTASPTAITADEIIDLEMSLNDAYAGGTRVGFMMNKTTLQLLRKLKDSQGRYLLELGMETTSNRLMLYNRPVFINYDMPAATAGKVAVLYGDMSRYVVRRTGGTRIVRDPYTQRISRDVDLFAVVEYADGNLINTGTPAVVALQMHA